MPLVRLGLNDSGRVVGSTGGCATTPLLPFAYGPHPVRWDNGVPTALGNLGGSMLGVGVSINDLGEVVGSSSCPSELPGFPFVQVHPPCLVQGRCRIWARWARTFYPADMIVTQGQVIGAWSDQGNCRAYLWENKTMLDLNALVPADSPLYLVFPEMISDAGEIVGMAIETSTGDPHAFLATPVKSTGAAASFAPEVQARDHADGASRQRPQAAPPPPRHARLVTQASACKGERSSPEMADRRPILLYPGDLVPPGFGVAQQGDQQQRPPAVQEGGRFSSSPAILSPGFSGAGAGAGGKDRRRYKKAAYCLVAPAILSPGFVVRRGASGGKDRRRYKKAADSLVPPAMLVIGI